MCGCRRLFLDDAHVESRQGLIRSFHQAEKYRDNPVVVPDLPWERAMGHNHGTVLFEGGRVRYWYQTYAFAREAAGTFHCAYAESTDGIRWEKPLLGRHELNGDRRNNVVAYDIGGVNIVHDDHDGDPAARYKMLYWGSGADTPGAIRGWMGSAGSLGLLYVLYGDPDEPKIRKKGFMDVQLAASRDGITWRRIGGHRPLIPRGSRGDFDAGMVGPNNGLVERDGRIWLYYNGWTGEHRETKAYRRANDPGLLEMGRLGCGTGLAWLRQDGFISVDAGEDEGSLTTKTERLGGMRLFVNARTADPSGMLMVEVLPGERSASDTVLARGAFRGDSVDAEVGGDDLPRLPSGEYRLRFRLRSGSLYSYRLAAGE